MGMTESGGQELSIARKVVAFSTASSWRAIPHAAFLYEPDVTAFYAIYQELKGLRAGPPELTFNVLLLKAIAEGIAAAPILNARLDYSLFYQTGRLRRMSTIDIATPVLSAGESITVVTPDVGHKTLAELANYMAALKIRLANTDINELLYRVALRDTFDKIKKLDPRVIGRLLSILFFKNRVKTLKGRAKKEYYAKPASERLSEKDVMTGTLIVSNIGPIYQGRGIPLLLEVIAPQIFAIGVGAMQERPLVCDDGKGAKQISIRRVLPLCLAIDHRALDFNHLAPFLQRLDDRFEKPEQCRDW
jgi:pyruvate/2-oxoglutarate dehydrogenase complex dihydrolipoamide acyltransferase (E2) component